jgi:hypothetical protein
MSAVLVRLPWIFTIPVHDAPDEINHWWVIEFLTRYARLPSSQEVAAGGSAAVYGSLPQMAYLPHALMAMFHQPADQLQFARFGSLFMGLVTVAIAWHVGRELFPQRKIPALALPALLIFHPQLVFVSSYCNNDSTTCALGSLVIYLLIMSLKRGLSWKRSAILGFLLGWLALCKFSGYILFPVAALSLAAAAFLHGASLSAAAGHFLVILSLVATFSTWWFIRNYQEFAGDILGTRTMYITWAKAYNKSLSYYLSPWQIISSLRWWRMFYFSFWGMFGYMNIYLWRPIYLAYVGYLLAATGGWIRSGYRKAIGNVAATDKIQIAIWLMMLLCCMANLAAMLWASTGNLGGPQGRYFFISEIPFAALLIEGLSRLGNRAGRIAIASLLVMNAVVCMGSWFMLVQRYGFGHINP